MIKWVILGAIDAFRAGAIDSADGSVSDGFSVRALAGDKGRPGFVQLLVNKYDFKAHMLNKHWLGKYLRDMPEADMTGTFIRALENHSSYRTCAQPIGPAAQDDLDLTWKHGWPQS